MNGSTDDRPPEIIIVRRPQVSGDGHHGGAWKIAFADFMTAMMALFLVLWLVNAANEETKKSVASYFNPVKLVDRNRSERGLSEADGPSRKRRDAPADSGDTSEEAGSAEEAAEAEPSQKDGAERSANFFESPEATMDKLAAQVAADGRDEPVEQIGLTNAEHALADDTIRDPFSVVLASVQSDRAPDQTKPKEVLERSDAEEQPSETETDARPESLSAELKAAAEAEGAEDRVSVEDTPEGTLITIRADTGAPMFASGSAEPDGKTVLLLAKLARVLAESTGPLRIGGHTDSTPFTRNDGYDNWRLSTDRAHAARLMLKRGGLNVARVSSVSGHAATQPLSGKAADYAGNRRITILLEGDGA
ncbi:MAG: flagellar motor protein MotB [Pseudomonadota bacterium]